MNGGNTDNANELNCETAPKLQLEQPLGNHYLKRNATAKWQYSGANGKKLGVNLADRC